eukprot:TRINITY_DN41864_c0_g1_i1.p1 TRINITY_DN41864_c0_g1~~TRINITY_DN41864_c0_g1_i1.p1  ORF type:complete len:241 (-),score=42.32 TRINITY_DN41864_c0_g1_i1:236-877(-)
MKQPIWARSTAARRRPRKQQVVKKQRRLASSLRKNELRAISLVCPELATAIFAKQKNVENRTWPLPASVRTHGGTWLALHVGAGRMPSLIRHHVQKAWDGSVARHPWNKMDPKKKRTGAPLPSAAIVGLIRIKAVHKLRRGERSENPWALGPLCWEIDRAIPLKKPITQVAGKLGLWSVEREKSISTYDQRRLRAALNEAKKRKGLGCFKPRS